MLAPLFSTCAMIALSILGGCPTPPPEEVPAGGPPPEAAASATDAASAALPGDPGTPVVFRASSEDEITFGRFIKEGDPTITITGNVSGASEYRVEFTALVPDASGQERPLAVHVQRFEGGTVSVKAPATFEHPLYVVVQDASIEPGKGEAPRGGALPKPIVLEGKDISFTIAVAEGVKMPFGEALPEGTPLPGPAPAAPAPAAPAPAEAAPAAPAGGPG